MAEKKSIINRVYDTFYYWLDIIYQAFVEFVDEKYTVLIRKYAVRFINAFASVFSLLVIFKTQEKNRFLRICLAPVKIIVGTVVASVLLIVFIVIALFFGALAGIFGLRNMSEYSYKEQLAAWSLVIILLVVSPFIFREFVLSKIEFCLAYSVILVGLCFLYGQCGIISIGHGCFVFLGGYFTAWLSMGTFFPPLPIVVSIFMAGLGAGLIGILLGLPSLRVRDHYLAIITLAFATIVPKFFKSPQFFAGYAKHAEGGIFITAPVPPSFLSAIPERSWIFYLVATISITLIFCAYNILHHSQIGRAFRVIRCDVEVSRAFGIAVNRYKLLAFVISAFYAGCAGGLLVVLIGFIGSDLYGFHESLSYMMAILIGGSRGILGTIFGGTYLSWENDIMRMLAELVPGGENLMRAASGVLVILVVYFFPGGIAGFFLGLVKSKFGRQKFRGAYRVLPPPDYDYLGQKSFTLPGDGK